MRILFVIFFSMLGSVLPAQNNDKELDSMRREMNRQRDSLDSNFKKTDSLVRERNKHMDSVNMADQIAQNNRNLDGLVRTIKERERKEKRAMWLRIGLGVSFLAIGIIGVMRKRKPKKKIDTR